MKHLKHFIGVLLGDCCCSAYFSSNSSFVTGYGLCEPAEYERIICIQAPNESIIC